MKKSNFITIKDVAKDCGVSPMTVSRVLNNFHYVSPEVKDRVLASVERLGYSPDDAGRRLSVKKGNGSQKTGNIGCILFNTYEKYSEPLWTELLEELDKVIIESNLHHYFTYTLKDLESPGIFTRKVNSSVIDGCVLVGLNDASLDMMVKIRERIGNVVLFGCTDDDSIRCVHPDGIQGGYIATNHLLSLGHRRIACITGFLTSHSDSKYRLKGYMDALADAGIKYDPEMVREGRFDIDKAACETRLLLQMNPRPTAIYSISDPMAIGVYKGIQEYGLRIPEDVSVIGFDDARLSVHIYPSLTSIGMDKKRMARFVVRLLQSGVGGSDTGGMKTVFPVKLVKRDSCCRPHQT